MNGWIHYRGRRSMGWTCRVGSTSFFPLRLAPLRIIFKFPSLAESGNSRGTVCVIRREHPKPRILLIPPPGWQPCPSSQTLLLLPACLPVSSFVVFVPTSLPLVGEKHTQLPDHGGAVYMSRIHSSVIFVIVKGCRSWFGCGIYTM